MTAVTRFVYVERKDSPPVYPPFALKGLQSRYELTVRLSNSFSKGRFRCFVILPGECVTEG